MRVSHHLFVLLAPSCVLFGCGSSPTFSDSDAGGSDANARSDVTSGTITADGGSSSEAGPGGDPSSISCGAVTCILPGESCCVFESTSPPSYACVAGAACPTLPSGAKGTALRCSAASNCPGGTVCCVTDNGGHPTSDCKAACATNEAQLCDPAAASTGCASGVTCSSANVSDWGLPTTYATCGGIGN